jgi:O-antigen/teichoic acid export membrane protein
MHLDKALVVTWLSMQEVGFYSVAFTFASIHASLGQALGFSSFAALANEPDISQQGLLIAKIFRQASLLYLAAGGAVALAAPWLIAPLFGAEFSPAAKVAALLALATSLAGLANVINEALRGMGNNYPGIGAKLLGSAILALAAWLLIPHFGLLGMAEAASLGAAIQLLILVISLSWLFSLRPAELWGLRLEEFKGLLNRVAAVIHYR